MTRSEISDAVILHTNRDDKLALIDLGITLAIKECCVRHAFKENKLNVDVSIVEGDNGFDLPETTLDVLSLRIKPTFDEDDSTIVTQTGSSIEIMTSSRIEKEVDAQLGEGNASGRPTFAWQERRTIRFVPKSNASYTLDLTYSVLESISEDDDSSNVSILDEALIAWATHYVFKSIGMHEDAERWLLEYERAFKHTRLQDNAQPGVSRQMRGAATHGVGQDYRSRPDYNVNVWTRD